MNCLVRFLSYGMCMRIILVSGYIKRYAPIVLFISFAIIGAYTIVHLWWSCLVLLT